ncbi:MAG: hypothetical protein ACRC2T_03760 [Thermoguttaceae bacterium]
MRRGVWSILGLVGLSAAGIFWFLSGDFFQGMANREVEVLQSFFLARRFLYSSERVAKFTTRLEEKNRNMLKFRKDWLEFTF